MSHFAKIDSNNIVTEIIVAEQNFPSLGISIPKSNRQKRDFFGAISASNQDYFAQVGEAMAALSSEDKEMTLPNGMKVNLDTLSGMTVFTTSMQLLQANIEFVNNIFTFIIE